jgi:3-oxoacyl-ACP reductase-like protein
MGVAIAFDFMRIRYEDLLWASSINDLLSLAFPPEIEEQKEEESKDDTGESRVRAQWSDTTNQSSTGPEKKRKYNASH